MKNRSHVFYTSLCVLADDEQDSYRDIVQILLLFTMLCMTLYGWRILAY